MNLPATPDFDKDKGIPGYDRGKKWPAWFAIAIPFVLLLIPLYKKVKGICWCAVFVTIIFFEITTLFIEHHSIIMGHWVYNRARILGILIWDIPIEEFLIYYLFPPVFVILIMQLFYQYFLKKGQ